MRTPTEPRRPAISLTVASPPEPDEAAEGAPAGPHLPWAVAAVVWTAGAAALGWLSVALGVSIAWLTAVRIQAVEVLATIGQGWLAIHGAPVRLGDATLDLPPLGLGVLVVAACGFAAHHAAQQFDLPPGAPPRGRWRAWALVVAACVSTYVVLSLVVASVVGDAGQIGPAVAGGCLVSLLGAAPGASRGLRLDPLAGLPGWVRRLPGAAGVGLAVMAAGSLVALVTALVAHWPRVTDLHAALAPDPVGGVLLVLLQLAWLPTLVLWAGSFVLGAGVALGAGSLVAPGVASIGVLPAVPVLGAVPPVPGAADWAWLVVGVAAGAASGWWVNRHGHAAGEPRRPAWVTGAWQGALAGLACGLVWVAASWLAVGDLGVNRLAGVGPRFPDLLWWATAPLALAGALAGAGWGLWLARRAALPEESATR